MIQSYPRNLTRRSLLKAAAGFGLLGTLPRLGHAAQNPVRQLRATSGAAQLLAAGEPATPIWGYDGVIPGPELRIRQGETLTATLRNDLPQPTTIHWHGIRIDNAMDGVAGLTQDAVPPGESFDYAFTVPDAGTYWYHPHNRSWEQLARGLYGVLVVEEDNPPPVDRDLVLVIDDWRLDEAGLIHEASLGSMRDWSHNGRLGNVLTVNGLDRVDLDVQAGERLRLRLLNVANARIFDLKLEGHAPVLIALDGQPTVPAPLPDGRVTLAPGQRTDLILDMGLDPGASAEIVALVGQQRVVAGAFRYHAEAVRRDNPLDGPMALPANPLPTAIDLAAAQEVELLMEGGAMGGMRAARFDGRQMDIRELVEHGMVWAFNGVAGRTDQPLFEAALGRPVIVHMRNRTAWPHAMHFHGHHMREVGGPGAPDALGPWRDTVLLDPDQDLSVAFVADNPGKWMLHCHMLEHQAAGMATWFRVGA